MSNWVETPEELAERQEDHAQDPDYDGRIDWDFIPTELEVQP